MIYCDCNLDHIEVTSQGEEVCSVCYRPKREQPPEPVVIRQDGPQELIARDREIMEHAVIAFVGLEYLNDFSTDDRILRDELGGDKADDELFALRACLAWVITRKAADVYRRGNGLPIPDERTDDVV